MQVINYPKQSISLIAVFSILLTACGGGGGGGGGSDTSGGTTSTNTTNGGTTSNSNGFNLTGTVPGTLIEAFCDDGSYYQTHSEQNGTSHHPYTLRLPFNVGCRVVMTTNETSTTGKVVTALRFRNSSGQDSTVLRSSSGDIDLGFVNLPLTRSAMRKDSNGDGVEDDVLEVSFDETQTNGIGLSFLVSDSLDTDRDGIPNIYEDDDGDGLPNRYDQDDDGDGIDDINDPDRDNDGRSDNDLDGDGIPNDRDQDDDNDGISDTDDSDDDNDGVDDEHDSDDDNDGIDDRDDDDYVSGNNGGNNVTVPDGGRLLASQCFQCHGTDGKSQTGIDSLAGESVAELLEEMLEMQAGAENDIMHYQALGYNTEQIRAMAAFFANQSKSANYAGDDD